MGAGILRAMSRLTVPGFLLSMFLFAQASSVDALLAAARQSLAEKNYVKASSDVDKLRFQMLAGAKIQPTRDRWAQVFAQASPDLQAIEQGLTSAEGAWRSGDTAQVELRLRAVSLGLAKLISRDPHTARLNALQQVSTEPSYPALYNAARLSWTVTDYGSCVDLIHRAIPLVPTANGTVLNIDHSLLGACYLARNERSKAIEALWASIRNVRSGSFKRMPPRMGLAALLLDAGEMQVVIEFLTSAAVMDWPDAAQSTARWISAIENGQKPDFGLLASF